MISEGQALLTGAVAGLMMRTQAEESLIAIQQVYVPRDGDGNYLPYVAVEMPSGWYRVQVSPISADIEEEP